MKQLLITCGLVMALSSTASAQLWTVDNTTPSHSEYANRNGTYYFHPNPNNHMGTSPNNAVYKNQAEFYNKDNYQRSLFPTSVGEHYTPGSQGYNNNGNNFINTNTPGSYNNRGVNGIYAPLHPRTSDPDHLLKR